MPIKGRGATQNQTSHRFALPQQEADGDWLDMASLLGDTPAKLQTSVTIEYPKTIITRNKSPDIPFTQSINPYRGCEHGCIYCFARPTHAYLDLSPGLDFESKLFAKPDAAKLLREAFNHPRYQVMPIAIGTNTDPYQPIESEYAIMRSILEVLAEYRHPVAITTKSDRIMRDMDILRDMARDDLVAVSISVTSLTPSIARTLEPRAPSPAKRLDAIRQLAEANIPVSAMIAPIIPAITDHEIEALVAAVANAGAQSAGYILVRLPHEVSPLFRAWLQEHYPDRASKVMAIIQSLRNGRDNDPNFFGRFRGTGPWADLLRTRFRIASKKAGLPHTSFHLRTDLFRKPQGPQLSLF